MKEVMNERNFEVLEGTERADWEVFRILLIFLSDTRSPTTDSCGSA
jgi:hypothetical protein